MELEEIKYKLQIACDRLYKERKYLIDEESNEISIGSYIESNLREQIDNWDIDSNYAREGVDRSTKRDSEGNIIIPDIVIHKHGPDGPNLAAVEIKGYWNRQPRFIDENKLRRLQEKHKYKFLFRIELSPDKAEVIQVDNAL